MVIRQTLRYCFLYFLCFLNLYAVDFTIEIDSDLTREGRPIPAKIIVTRDCQQKVDLKSFILDGEKLDVELLYESRQSSITVINGKRREQNNLISTYNFEIPGKNKGRHVLSAISLKIDGLNYYSQPVTYEVCPTEEKSSFRLMAEVDKPTPLYPGQHLTITYRIVFTTPIEATFEELSLLDLPGFKKRGDRSIRTYNRGEALVKEISQEFEAQRTGSFEFGSSIIEGFPFREDFFGRRIYQKPKLRAEAKPIVIEVLDFPEKSRPKSFNGAIGKYSLQASLISKKAVSVGDKLEVEVRITGGDELASVRLPDLANQEKFKGNFRFSDLPPVGKITGATKVFVYELRPMSPHIKEIPAVEFSYFNPKTCKYETEKSQPISIDVTPLSNPQSIIVKNKEPSSPAEQNSDIAIQDESWKEHLFKPKLIEITGNYQLFENDFIQKRTPFSILYLFPIGAAVIFGQLGLRQYLTHKQKQMKKMTSEGVLNQAINQKKDSGAFFHLIEIALLEALREKGYLEKTITSPEELDQDGITGKVRDFLCHIATLRFSGNKKVSVDKIIQQAKSLFKEIKS